VKITCPVCGSDYPIEAGLLEDDGKRLAAVVAGMEPLVARAALAYLRLFKPAKAALRTSRAIKLLQDLGERIASGAVSRDERAGVRRRTTPAMWAAGIDQMLQQQGSLELPLSNHNYLRKVVYAIADAADLDAERRREAGLRRGRREPDPATGDSGALNDHLLGLKSMLDRGFLSEAEYALQVNEAKTRAEGCVRVETERRIGPLCREPGCLLDVGHEGDCVLAPPVGDPP